MIALDTNVLVRFVVEDDPEQSARALSSGKRQIAPGSINITPGDVAW